MWPMMRIHFRAALQWWLVWPMAVWGAMIVLSNGVGLVLLEEIPGPVAMLNAVNHVNVSG